MTLDSFMHYDGSAKKLLRSFTTLALFLSLFGSYLTTISVDLAFAQEEEVIEDPFENVNRGIFWFNNTVDEYALEPIAKGYDFVVPGNVQKSIGNFFDNLKFPVRLVSDLLQFKFEQAGNHTGRFVLNTTFGIAGLFDAAESFGLEAHHEDIGTMFANHGMGPGPYLMLPFFGPSNARDTLGRGIEFFLDPIFYLEPMGLHEDDAVAIAAGLTATDVVNTRSKLLEPIQAAKDASLDYYLFVRKAYYQIRYEQIYDKAAPEPEDFDDEFADEFGDEFEDDEKLAE